MSYVEHEEVYKGFTIKIVAEDNPESPREWDNAGKMACWHSRYNLGDIQPKERPAEFMKNITSKTHVILPLYLYDHSGISMSTDGDRYPFNDRWDAGQVGWIYISKKNAVKEWGNKKFTNVVKEKALNCLRGEVATYNHYLNGEVYGFQVWDGEDIVESCYGFYPDEKGDYDECLGEAKSVADWLDEEKTQRISIAQVAG